MKSGRSKPVKIEEQVRDLPGKSNTPTWSITEKELFAWLDGIASVRTLLAPRSMGKVTLYQQVAGSSEIAADFTRPLLSIKEAFFPPTERLFMIHKTGMDVRLEEELPECENIIYGVRPCDARGGKLLDALFLDTNPVDPMFARRRQNTTLIGIACQEPGPTCFCTSVGGAPDDATGMDIMLYRSGAGYLVQAVTEKGRFLIPGGEWKETDVRPHPMTLTPEFSRPEKEEWPGHFKDEFWAKIGERCLSCRACAYVCPTCRCFIARDEQTAPGEYERIRCWDSCMGENYRRVAGGHKPRTRKGERQRNRFFCKFYYFPEQYGLGEVSACTGCGRCIEVCPVGVDVTEVLMEMEAA